MKKRRLLLFLVCLIGGPSSFAGALRGKVPGAERRVYWDVSHGVYLEYEPSGYFSDLSDLLTSRGFEVETGTEGVLSVPLNTYDVLVVCLASAWDTAYSEAEVDAIEAFVRMGGGLLLLSDDASIQAEHIAQIAARFATSFGDRAFTGDLYTDLLAPWSVFEGVQTLHFSAASTLEAFPPMVPRAWSPQDELLMVSGTFGGGVVVVISDVSLFHNDHLPTADNLRFAENLFDYFVETRVPTLGSVGLGVMCLLLAVTGLVMGRRKRAVG